MVALLGLCAVVIVSLRRSSAPGQSILKIESLFRPGARVGYMGRTEPLRVINISSNAILIGSQYRVERKDTGEIVAATRKAKATVLPGKSRKNSMPQTVAYTQLTGTNHGPWRLLVPVGHYRLIAGLESLFGKAPGTWIKNWAWLNSYLERINPLGCERLVHRILA